MHGQDARWKTLMIVLIALAVVITAGVGVLAFFLLRDRITGEDREVALTFEAAERVEIPQLSELPAGEEPDAGEDDASSAQAGAGESGLSSAPEDAGASDDPEDVSGNSADGEEPAEAEEEPATEPWADEAEDRFTHRFETSGENVISVAFAGDILFDRSYSIQSTMEKRGGGIRGAVGETLLAEMNRVDLMVINNEFPYTDRGAPQAGKTYTFHAAPRTVRQLKEMGADLVSLANNHSFDYGEQGFLDTLDTLDRAGVPRVGAGRDISEAAHPVYFIADGMKLGFVAATQIERQANPNTRGATDTLPGVFRCMDDKRLLEQVREAKENSDFVIVFVHWGTESETQPDHLQKKQAPEIADAGADLIIGCHSHCLQPLEIVHGVPVVYSLGNFLFNSRTLDTCLIEAEIGRVAGDADEGAEAASGTDEEAQDAAPDGSGETAEEASEDSASADGTSEGAPSPGVRLKSLRFLPCIQSGCTVRFADEGESARILKFMRDISPGTEIDEEGWIGVGAQ